MIMCLISQSMKVGQNLNVWEISFLKLYLIVAAFILSIWFPVILSADMWIYISVAVILMVLTFCIILKQQGNFYKTVFNQGFGVQIFKKMGMFDFGVFKLTMFTFGLILAKIFPVLLTVHIAWYIAIACIFIGYYINSLFHA